MGKREREIFKKIWSNNFATTVCKLDSQLCTSGKKTSPVFIGFDNHGISS